jgi:hypothetical protein
LQALADSLLPGDGHFPAASAVGAHGLLAERLRERLGRDAIDEVGEKLLEATGSDSLADLDDEVRIEAVRRFERDAPELFAAVRNILYFSYYQSPLVVEAIRALGIPYNDAPQPYGYLMEPFDPTPGKDAPAEPRGSYIPTASVSRLANLPTAARATEREQ